MQLPQSCKYYCSIAQLYLVQVGSANNSKTCGTEFFGKVPNKKKVHIKK